MSGRHYRDGARYIVGPRPARRAYSRHVRSVARKFLIITILLVCTAARFTSLELPFIPHSHVVAQHSTERGAQGLPRSARRSSARQMVIGNHQIRPHACCGDKDQALFDRL
jgi:hypothetical protein